VKEEGYLVEHGGLCITVFSAPNYCDQMGNKGAFITFTRQLRLAGEEEEEEGEGEDGTCAVGIVCEAARMRLRV
jgi:hypothetical protein